ncbi:hypothetical protein H257_02938 [Aphanomyces astaci]|uniref:Uncharacterized protein n=1 Tax=Aphanomyces astaci TaxID=112090 RepID=W4H0I9_APHAT|nr:hypothetical protein H257_02938 [Aphanomyces astaci]ETV85061.1 hypothetical protein H257_02938 [Aphanomyces astaci]|eukprot:XP_009825079.1 hypothetical protein H257_02938 [Aphanomyces astaci]
MDVHAAEVVFHNVEADDDRQEDVEQDYQDEQTSNQRKRKLQQVVPVAKRMQTTTGSMATICVSLQRSRQNSVANTSIDPVIASGPKRLNVKAASGRGRRRADWVTYVYAELLSEFHRLKSAGVKFSPALLVQLARMVVDNAPAEEPWEAILLGAGFKDSSRYEWYA